MKQKGIVLLPIVIIIALLGTLGYFIFQNLQLREIVESPEPTPTTPNTNMPTPSQTPGPTTNLKTYTDEKFKISFQHPSNWQEVINSNKYFELKTEYEGVFVLDKNTFSPDIKDERCYTEKSLDSYYINNTEIKRSAIQYYGGGPYCNVHELPFVRVEISAITSDNSTYYIYYGEPPTMWNSFKGSNYGDLSEMITKQFNQILSTINFTQ